MRNTWKHRLLRCTESRVFLCQGRFCWSHLIHDRSVCLELCRRIWFLNDICFASLVVIDIWSTTHGNVHTTIGGVLAKTVKWLLNCIYTGTDSSAVLAPTHLCRTSTSSDASRSRGFLGGTVTSRCYPRICTTNIGVGKLCRFAIWVSGF